MIRVVRPAAAPADLNSGVAVTQVHCEHYDANRAWHCSTKGRFTFDKGLYGCPAVRQTLPPAQYWKCCYCEAKFRHAAPGDIEHFRPKGAWKQVRSEKLHRPGYYWLAYSWTNLLWSCIECNRQAKANLFPLRDPAERAQDHHHRWEDEDPLLIDPAGPLDPRLHIRFEREVAKGITPEGKTTINVLKLNREPLLQARRTRLKLLRLLQIATKVPEEAASATRELQRVVLPQASFSALAQDFLAGGGAGEVEEG